MARTHASSATSSAASSQYAPRIDNPQPAEFDVAWTVVATRDGVPVLQRAEQQAQPVREPLKQGEEFETVYVVIGNDKRAYWVTKLRSRVLVDGTAVKDGPQLEAA